MSATETYSGQDVLASYLRERREAEKLDKSAFDDLKEKVKSERDGDGLRTYWKGVIEERRKVKRKSDDEEKENFYPSSKRSRSIISLVCLVKGNTIANAFPIDIDRNQLVGHLKQVIREEIDIPENVKAKDLRLWKVEIPDDHDDQLRNLPLQDKDELLATKKISRYFPFTLPEEHINIIIKLPLLSMEEALSYPPPYIKYSPYGTTSKSTTRVGGTPPKKVMLWEDFFESVNKYSFDELDQEQKFKEPIFIDDFIVTEEEVVRQAINVNICLILNRLIPVFKFSMRKVHSTGKPDFCCHYLDKLLTLVIEAKRVHILESIEDGQTLPDFYKTNAKIRAVVQQLYNYMSENQLQFGVLSTYDRHWFVKRDYQDVYISESLPLDSKSPPVLKSYAYIALQEKESPYSLHPNRVRVQTEGAQQSRYDLRPRRLHNNSSSSSNT